MDISELHRERDAFRKRQQAAEIAEMEAKIAGLQKHSKELDAQFLQLAELCYSMTLQFAAMAHRNPHAKYLTWAWAVMTKGSLMMINEDAVNNVA